MFTVLVVRQIDASSATSKIVPTKSAAATATATATTTSKKLCPIDASPTEATTDFSARQQFRAEYASAATKVRLHWRRRRHSLSDADRDS